MNSFLPGASSGSPADDANGARAWMATADSLSQDFLLKTSHPLATSETSSTSSYSPVPPIPPLQQRMAWNQMTTLPWSLQRDLEEYTRHQVAGVGVYWRKLVEGGIRRSVRRIQQSGLPVSSLGWIGGFTGEHGHSLKETIKEARTMIRVAGQLRAGNVTVITGPLAGHIRSHASRLVCSALRELVQFAAIYGVQLILQPMHAQYFKKWSFVNSIDDAMEIIDRVADPRLKIAFGTYHLGEEQQLFERLESLVPRIGMVSLSDWGAESRDEHDRLLPGKGRLPLAELVQSLESWGFSGWYELEVWSRDLWKLDYRDLMQQCLDAQQHLVSSLAGN